MTSDEEVRFWDEAANTYDELARHGIRSDIEVTAWRNLFERYIRPTRRRILDVGTGTGAVAVMLAGLGHDVVGVDSSEEMLRRALSKASAAGLSIDFQADDITSLLTIPSGSFDIVISRHVLWTLTDPVPTVARWRDKVGEGGQVIAIDGCWSTSQWRTRTKAVLNPIFRRIGHLPREHGASYYDELEPTSLPLRRLSAYEPAMDVFNYAGLKSVEGEWLAEIDAAERQGMTLIERFLEHGRRYAIRGTRMA